MNYIIHKPAGILADYIKCIWLLDEKNCTSSNFCTTLIPSGSIEIIFHFGGRGKYSNKQEQFDVVTNNSISGQKSKHSSYYSNGTNGILAVMLQPIRANLLLGHPANLFSNKTYELESIFGNSVDRLIDKLNSSFDSFEKISLVEKYFEEIIRNITKYFDPRIEQFEKIIRGKGGNVNILTLSDTLNISKRQLERNVLNSIGLTPKEFCRVVRFQKVLHIKQNNNSFNCTDLAYSSGFSDQAHFISDFKSISGFTPKEYFKISNSFSDYYSYN